MRTKSRLTITLSKDLLKKIDTMVGTEVIKNRSHAIETLIEQSLAPKINTAVILAGGKNTGAANSSHPMLKTIGEGTLLAHTLNVLKKNHITHIILCLSQKDTAISKKFGNGEKMGIKIEYSFEKKPFGTGGAVKKIQPLLGGQPFLVIHGDVLTTLNFTDLCEFHTNEKALATIAVKPRMGEAKYGQVFIHGNKIIRFLENSADAGISIVNTGVYVFDPEIFDVLPQKQTFTLEKDVFPQLAKKSQLSASIFQGIWYDISTEKNYQQAQQHWQEIASS